MSGVKDLAPVGRIGRYDILGRLATGGMAEIFLARESGPREASRTLVVKRILPHVAEDPDYVESFVAEATLSLRLSHPSICGVVEFGEEAGRYFLAMEYVRGVSLHALIERVGPMPMGMSVRLVADVANALTHAHGARDDAGKPLGIVHRDVTPDNLMVGFDGTVKLLDFGIAKSSAQLRKTQQGQLKGKLAYMSPEQYRGERLDGRSDLFSLGLCLYEALTGQALYARGTEAETVAAILFDEEPPSVRATRPEVPEMLDRIVQTMLAKDRQKRATTAEAVSAALEKWLVLERQAVREADIAGFVQAMFPGRADSLPELDRTPLKPAPRRDSIDPIKRQAIGADLDDLTEEMERRQAAKRRQVGLLVALVLIAGAAARAWALSKPPAPAPAANGPTPIAPG